MSGASNDSNMKQPKAKLRKRWVDSELEEVKSLRKKGASHGDIALHFGVSTGAINHQFEKMRATLALPTRQKSPSSLVTTPSLAQNSSNDSGFSSHEMVAASEFQVKDAIINSQARTIARLEAKIDCLEAENKDMKGKLVALEGDINDFIGDEFKEAQRKEATAEETLEDYLSGVAKCMSTQF